MTDESTNPIPPPFPPEAAGQKTGQPTVAFCQQCGRGLTVDTVRAVGSGIFCEPCATRGGAAPTPDPAGAAAAGYTPVPSPATGGGFPPPPISGEPNPVLAGFLGLIPGVGAMYNGQYSKGVIHLVIFVVLTSLADNLNWVLWWFVWGWIFYQAFEAYHTAQARRDGLPLPDPFGWNDLGDRLGLDRTSPPVSSPSAPSPSRAGFQPAPDASGPSQPSARTTAPSSYASNPAAPLSTEAPTEAPGSPLPDAFPTQSSWSTPAPAAAIGSKPPSVPHNSVPYEPPFSPTYTGVPWPSALPPTERLPLAQRFPAGAAWLIGLGVLFLVGNLAPRWRLEARWLVPALLALVAVWTGGRRVEAMLRQREVSMATGLANLAEGLVGPAVLLTVAVLLALQNAYLVPLRHSWPVVLIVWGALLLFGRARPPIQPPLPGAAARDHEAPLPGNGPSL